MNPPIFRCVLVIHCLKSILLFVPTLENFQILRFFGGKKGFLFQQYDMMRIYIIKEKSIIKQMVTTKNESKF